MRPILLLLLAIIALSGCKTESSDDVIVSAIWQGYYCEYDKTADQTKVMAEFRDGGPLGNDVILYSPSGITFNGEKMNYSAIPYDLLYHHYGLPTFTGELNNGVYIFTDKNGKTYTNSVNFNSIAPIEFPVAFDTISKSADLVLSWIGAPVAENETVELSIIADTTNAFGEASILGSTFVTIPKSSLAVLTNGIQSVSIYRKIETDLQAATSKGGQIVQVYSINKLCVITD